MQSWVSLWKKDFRLTRTFFLASIVINILLCILALFLRGKFDEPLAYSAPLLAAAAMHLFYMPAVLFVNLRVESHPLHLWLHNPWSATALIASKLANAALQMTLSLLMLYGMLAALILPATNALEPYWGDTRLISLLAFPHIVLMSAAMSIWVVLLWSFYHSIKFRIGRWSWLAVVGLVLLLGFATNLFESSQLYASLFHWGGMTYNPASFSADPIPFYAGEYLYQLILVSIIFKISTWMVDNKVEV